MTDVDYRRGRSCLDCGERLVDTGETFDRGPMQKYVCPECGETFQVERAYKVTRRK